MALLLYLTSHWVLVIITVLSVVALGAAARVFKNIKLVIAAVVVAIAGFMYQGAVMHGIQLQLGKDLAQQVEISNGRLKALGDLTLKDATQAKADADVIE